MNQWAVAGTALALVAGAVLLWKHGPRPAPGRHLPPLHRPPCGSTQHIHRQALPWCDVEVEPPPWRHHCWPHSGSWKKTDTGHVWFERCPCGAWRQDDGPWRERNRGRGRKDAAQYIQPSSPGFFGDQS